MLAEPRTPSPNAANSISSPDTFETSEPKNGLIESLCFFGGGLLCFSLAGAGIYYAVTRTQHRPMHIMLGVLGVLAGAWVLEFALKRIAFYQDNAPKVTLTPDTFGDRRTKTKVYLAEVKSIRFDNRHGHKGVELVANLHVTLKDGTEHVFNLLRLELPSEEIVWRLSQRLGMTDAEGIKNPEDTAQIKAWGQVIGVILIAIIVGRAVYDVCF